MIDKQYGKYIPTCDVCGETLEAELSFDEAVAEMKSESWKTKAVMGEWENICPECQKAR